MHVILFYCASLKMLFQHLSDRHLVGDRQWRRQLQLVHNPLYEHWTFFFLIRIDILRWRFIIIILFSLLHLFLHQFNELNILHRVYVRIVYTSAFILCVNLC